MDSIIFDVDGTLWDSREVVAKSWTRIAQRDYDKDMIITAKRLQGLFGKTMYRIAAELFPNASTEEQHRLIDLCGKVENEDLLKERAEIYPHLEHTLSALSRKYKLYIVSNCQCGYIEAFLMSTGFGKYFSGHLCSGDTGMEKGPNLQKIIADHHMESPVYVGDTMGDYEATREAGIPFVYASYGFGAVAQPEYTIDGLKDLLTLF